MMKAGSIENLDSLVVSSGSLLPFWFDVDIVRTDPEPIITSESEVFYNDRNYLRIENELVSPNFTAKIIRQRVSREDQSIERLTSDPNVCVPAPNDENKWLYVGDGAATCTVRSASREVDFNVNLSQYSEPYFEKFLGYKTDSLAYHIIDTVLSRIVLNGDVNIFSVLDHDNSNYVRNANCWVFDLPSVVAPFSVWNSRSGQRRAGNLITPQDISFTVHYQLLAGDVVRFVGIDGSVHDRTIVQTKIHPDWRPVSPDIAVGHLDSPLPSEVPFAKILPTNWKNYLPSQGFDNTVYNYPGNYPWPLPAFAGNQKKEATLNEWVGTIFQNNMITANQVPTNPLLSSYYRNKISGDSNSPGGLIVNEELVLIEQWSTGGVGGGAELLLYKDDINQMLADLGSNYTLTEADFSMFPTY